ncbi:alpha/beta hydrolase [Herbiconiux sp. CPCC 205763]|uniref:Alpha/beta hydrolase n=1 Tax=Herbiconiux aconitum TaxID=2970913 RepID=A0ABT2GQN1_9MICO|nr:alpha/beta hydrolase [Herbiconiux aconitum]MCS5718528.1 alpha/beta hydrolase [Herbiconiux aconitum]
MTEYTTTARGDRVAYDLRGSGPAIVFVAGAGPFRAIDPWTTETAERAADLGLATLVFDRLGRGESEADGVLDLDRELDALRAVIEVAGGAAVLCGHSSGCSISLHAAAVGLPVTGLALWEAPLAGDATQTRAWSNEVERLIDAGDFPGALSQYMKDMPPEWLDEMKATPEWEYIAAGVRSNRADGQSMVWATAALEAAEANGAAETNGAEGRGVAGALAGIRVPVLAMYGLETFPEMPVAAERIAAAIPGTVVKAVPGAEHSWEPAPMAHELAAFVKAVAARV